MAENNTWRFEPRGTEDGYTLWRICVPDSDKYGIAGDSDSVLIADNPLDWQQIPVEDKNLVFRFYNKASNSYLSLADDQVVKVSTKADDPAQYWIKVDIEGSDLSYLCNGKGLNLVARSDADIKVTDPTAAFYPTDIDYDMDKLTSTEKEGEKFTFVAKNSQLHPSSMSVSTHVDWSENRAWNHEIGANVTLGDNISVGVPAVAEGDGFEVAGSSQFAWEQETTETYGTPVVPPFKLNELDSLKIIISVPNYDVVVPYTVKGTVKTKSGLTFGPIVVPGTYQGRAKVSNAIVEFVSSDGKLTKTTYYKLV